MRFRYRHCCVSVIMWPSGYFRSPHLALGAIWVWDPCCKPWLSAIPAAYLLCSTAIRRDIRAAWCFCSCKVACRNVGCVLLHCFIRQPYVFAVVKCVDVAYRLHSILRLMHCRIFLQLWTTLCFSVECCVFLRFPNLEHWYVHYSDTLYKNE